MKKLFVIILLFLMVGCGPGTPEQQAQRLYEHHQRFETEMNRLENNKIEIQETDGFLSSFLLVVVGGVIGWGSCSIFNLKKG